MEVREEFLVVIGCKYFFIDREGFRRPVAGMFLRYDSRKIIATASNPNQYMTSILRLDSVQEQLTTWEHGCVKKTFLNSTV